MAPCLDVYARRPAPQKDRAQALLAEMFTAEQLAQGSITSQQIAQAAATLAENTRDPKVGAAIRRQRDLKGKLDTLYSQRDDLTQGQRQGAPNNPEIVARAAALDKEIAQTHAKIQDADCGVAGGIAELRPARAAGGDGAGSVRGAASGRGVRGDRRSPTWTAGYSCCATRPSGVEDRCGPAGHRRPGEADPRGHRADHCRVAAVRCGGRAAAVPADAGRRGEAA